MRVLWLSGLVVILDQVTKYVVLQTMYLGQQIALVGDWLKFTFTENPGMAFGITFGPKAMVTVFSIIATVLITMYLVKVRKGYFPYRASLGLILGGAIGNIIDRVFYGVLYGDDAFFYGKVVDFIHVNVWSGFVPESVPFIGGTYLSLFPIWNVADMAIVCGVVGILAFQKEFHLHEHGLDATNHRRETPDDDLETRDHAPGGARPAIDLPREVAGVTEATVRAEVKAASKKTDYDLSTESHLDEPPSTTPLNETRKDTTRMNAPEEAREIESTVDGARGESDQEKDKIE